MKLSEQTVLVTGAGRGLGSAIARAFAAQGADVVVNYRRSVQSAERLAAEIGGLAVAADVTQADQVETMFTAAQQHFGKPVTTVVNNALADFSFNGDARSTADTITWEEFDAPEGGHRIIVEPGMELGDTQQGTVIAGFDQAGVGQALRRGRKKRWGRRKID